MTPVGPIYGIGDFEKRQFNQPNTSVSGKTLNFVGAGPFFGRKSVSDPLSQYFQARLGTIGSDIGQNIFSQYEQPGIYGGKPSFDSAAAQRLNEGLRQEANLLNKMKSQEAEYDRAYSQALKAKEMAKTGSGVYGKDLSSVVQTIGGSEQAGVEKSGKYKSIYGSGSMLPASWMQSKIDPAKFASKISGLEDREAPETLTIAQGLSSSGVTPEISSTYYRSKFNAPTVQKTGLGRYSTII